MDKFIKEKFKNINLDDSFFDSLKNDYTEFSDWFTRKQKADESAYIQTVDDVLEGFLYLKEEFGDINDINPILKCIKSIKIGTMKINPHGTRLGERFIKKSLDFAISKGCKIIYVTVFEKHAALKNLYLKYGFEIWGDKETKNGKELVLVKNLEKNQENIFKNYPKIDIKKNYLLSIHPQYHTRLFPESILKNESFNILEDVSYTNSIEKIYLCKMKKAANIKSGDNIIIYRTSPDYGKAEYKSVATSICKVIDVRLKSSFTNIQEYLEFCKNYSIFTDDELISFYNDENEWIIIKMLYNIALPKRITRHDLIEKIGLRREQYWGVVDVSKIEMEKIIEISKINRDYIF